MTVEMASMVRARETRLIQSLLSRLSCKLRMDKRYFEFVDSANVAIYLEPVGAESQFPIDINFPDDTSSTSYRSLIKLNPAEPGSEYLGEFDQITTWKLTKFINRFAPLGLRATSVKLRDRVHFPR